MAGAARVRWTHPAQGHPLQRKDEILHWVSEVNGARVMEDVEQTVEDIDGNDIDMTDMTDVASMSSQLTTSWFAQSHALIVENTNLIWLKSGE